MVHGDRVGMPVFLCHLPCPHSLFLPTNLCGILFHALPASSGALTSVSHTHIDTHTGGGQVHNVEAVRSDGSVFVSDIIISTRSAVSANGSPAGSGSEASCGSELSLEVPSNVEGGAGLAGWSGRFHATIVNVSDRRRGDLEAVARREIQRALDAKTQVCIVSPARQFLPPWGRVRVRLGVCVCVCVCVADCVCVLGVPCLFFFFWSACLAIPKTVWDAAVCG